MTETKLQRLRRLVEMVQEEYKEMNATRLVVETVYANALAFSAVVLAGYLIVFNEPVYLIPAGCLALGTFFLFIFLGVPRPQVPWLDRDKQLENFKPPKSKKLGDFDMDYYTERCVRIYISADDTLAYKKCKEQAILLWQIFFMLAFLLTILIYINKLNRLYEPTTIFTASILFIIILKIMKDARQGEEFDPKLFFRVYDEDHKKIFKEKTRNGIKKWLGLPVTEEKPSEKKKILQFLWEFLCGLLK